MCPGPLCVLQACGVPTPTADGQPYALVGEKARDGRLGNSREPWSEDSLRDSRWRWVRSAHSYYSVQTQAAALPGA